MPEDLPPPPELPRGGPRHGFTLVELLVVLSILAILGSMAVPAVKGALDRADRAVCLSNLRQLGQALSEYVADHGHYPPAELEIRDAAGRVAERKRWYHALAPYLDTGPRAWSSGQGRVKIDPVTGLADGVVLPSEDDRDQEVFPPVFRCPRASHWEVGRNMSYGYNHQTLGDARLVGITEEGAPVHRHYPIRRFEIEDRSRTVVLLDSRGTGEERYRPGSNPRLEAEGNHAFTVDPPVLPARPGPGGMPVRWGSDGSPAGIGEPTRRSVPAGRHRGGCCVLYADGRVEWTPLERLLRDDALWNGTGKASPGS